MKTIQSLMLVAKALRDNTLPGWVKLIALAGVGYIVFPIDVIPDLVPVLGWIDDLAVGLIVVRQIVVAAQKIPKPLLARA